MDRSGRDVRVSESGTGNIYRSGTARPTVGADISWPSRPLHGLRGRQPVGWRPRVWQPPLACVGFHSRTEMERCERKFSVGRRGTGAGRMADLPRRERQRRMGSQRAISDDQRRRLLRVHGPGRGKVCHRRSSSTRLAADFSRRVRGVHRGSARRGRFLRRLCLETARRRPPAKYAAPFGAT